VLVARCFQNLLYRIGFRPAIKNRLLLTRYCDTSKGRERSPDILTKEVKENALSFERANERNSLMNRGDLADLNAFVAVADQPQRRV